MDEKPVDRRVRKTKRQLRLALMQLMSEKNVKDISVRELAAIADINRGTFYIHYKDVYDLLSQLEEEMAQGLIKVCRAHHAEESSGSTFPYLSDLYVFIKENADLCRVLLGANGDKAYTDRICKILRDEQKQSAVRGLFPCGEGAGYAGGIMSAAADGMVCAEALISSL